MARLVLAPSNVHQLRNEIHIAPAMCFTSTRRIDVIAAQGFHGAVRFLRRSLSETTVAFIPLRYRGQVIVVIGVVANHHRPSAECNVPECHDHQHGGAEHHLGCCASG